MQYSLEESRIDDLMDTRKSFFWYYKFFLLDKVHMHAFMDYNIENSDILCNTCHHNTD